MRISINPVLFSHGRGGLEGARPSSTLEHHFLAEVSHPASILTAPYRSRKFPPRNRFHSFEEVWRESGPPAPATIIFSRQPAIFPPLPIASRRSWKFPSRYCCHTFEEVWRAPGPSASLAGKLIATIDHTAINFHQIQLGKINAVKRHNGDNPLHF